MGTTKAKLDRALTWRYLLALSLVACLSTGAFLALYLTLSAQEQQAGLIREVAKQQAASQRVAFFANAYAAAQNGLDRQDYHRELGRSIRTMERSHQRMIEGLGLKEADVARVRELLFAGDSPFDEQVRKFLNHAKLFHALPWEEVRKDHPYLLSLNLAGMNFIPQGFDLISNILEDESREAIRYLENFEIAVWLTTLFLLLLEALLIFRPLVRKVQSILGAYEEAREESERLATSASSANRAKSDFLASMSHELRTPLNAIIGFSEVMSNECFGALGNPKYREYPPLIHQSAQHLLEIINDVLDLSKVEAGRLELNETRFEVTVLVEECCLEMAGQAAAKHIALSALLGDGPRVAYADRRLIKQSLLNLLSNAIKFSERHQAITINTVFLPMGQWRVSVRDHGVGMQPDQIEMALRPFEQVQNVHTRNHEGTGLGLALVHEYMRLHGGRLELTSELGQGTEAVLLFPRYRAIHGALPHQIGASPDDQRGFERGCASDKVA